MNPLLALLASSFLVLSACTATRAQQASDAERMLAAAGFHKTAMSPMKTLPERQLVALGEEEDRWYEFVDREFCRCSYVGFDKSYAALRELRAARVLAHDSAPAGLEARFSAR